MASFAKSVVEDFIGRYGNIVEIIRNRSGFDLYRLAGGAMIRLPAGNKRIDEELIWAIAEMKLGIDSWEFDYWLGQQN